MDYCLDAGDGTASIWTGQLDIDIDGDGELDGVRMDFDGDGVFDDGLADFDADGLADHAALDLDDDGVPESRYTDDGSGSWTLSAGGAGARSPRWFGLDGVEHTDPGSPSDIDGDGVADRLFDSDRDGLADRALRADPEGRITGGYVDTDGDGQWDVALADSDGDGAADGAAAL
jgi:hypothetical protein